MPEHPPVACVGLATLDVVYAVDHVPAPNEKTTARRCTVSAGGPAANAAVAAARLGSPVTLVTAIGRHPLAAGVRADLADQDVTVVDAVPRETSPPPLSTIMVTAGTGQRAVVSRNAEGWAVPAPPGLATALAGVAALLVDGHHPELALAALRSVRPHGVRTLLDAGSWKDAVPSLLPMIDVVIASADFAVPGVAQGHVLDHLLAEGVAFVAVTDGPAPVRWKSRTGAGTVAVPAVDVVDTLGAGDVFHGAALHALAGATVVDDEAFVTALETAAAVAARSCGSFGTRDWLAAPLPHLA
jgi:sugar/nucleoside kinase (ribokinase family)